MRKRNPDISVIVPIYNAEKYLSRCIDSILSQTFENFELLLIDDGSTDKSGVICDKYAEIDSRIEVFHKLNGGVSSARNLGLENAQGKWIIFIDSDDWVQNSLWHDCYNSEVDLIITSFVDIRGDNNTILSNSILLNVDVGKYLQSKIGENIFRGPIAKLFKRDIINKNKLRFDDKIKLGEDTLFVRQYMMWVEYLQTSNAVFYVVSDTFSLSASLIPVDCAVYTIDSLCNSLKLLEKEKNIKLTNVRINDVRFFFIRTLKYIIVKNESIEKRKCELKKLLKNENIQMLLTDSFHIHKGPRRKLFDFLAKYKLNILLVLYLRIYQYD